MIYKTIDLSEAFDGLKRMESGTPTLTAYVPDNLPPIDMDRHRPSVIVIPGGGYRTFSDKEAEPVALAYMGKGFNTFLLRYTLWPEATYPTQLLQAAAAVAYIRQHADEYHADPDAISVIGFSAGGHLAGSIGTLWKDEVVSKTLGIDAKTARPDAMILCYAVLSSVNGHVGSIERVGGGDPEIMEHLSIDKRVADDTPPTYIFTTMDDQTVDARSSILTALALQEHGVPYEMHIYKHGEHGYSLGSYVTQRPSCDNRVDPYVAQWFDESVHFLKELFGKKNI